MTIHNEVGQLRSPPHSRPAGRNPPAGLFPVNGQTAGCRWTAHEKWPTVL
jgi:hypothetical protein